MYCDKCGNQNIAYFGKDKFNHYYCRKCIEFNGTSAQETIKENKTYALSLDYPLSPKQDELSKKIMESFSNHKNCLVYAVCGAGKTELVYETILYALNDQKQVGFCIPRKDVVIELESRIKDAFKEAKVVSVYGGHSEVLTGDIILLTTHQLYRYNSYFDLLIIDEADAFPYKNNLVLNHFFKKSIKGNYVMLSATPLEENIKEITQNNDTYLTLMTRYHNHPLIVPKVIVNPFLLKIYLFYYLYKFKKLGFPVFIFVPTIEEVETMYKSISVFFKKGNYVHSKRIDRDKIIDDFKKGKYQYLVTSSVLERGVTVKNLQVIVYKADDSIYDSSALIQISGRVGRKIDAWDGQVIFLCQKSNPSINNALTKIKEANSYV